MRTGYVNFWVDVGIGIAGAISAISGLVFLLPADLTSGILGISLRMWSSLHTWSSLAAVAGVGVHLALHWKWAMAMTRQMLPTQKQRQVTVSASESIPAETGGGGISQRAFLAIGGIAAVVTGLVAASYKVISKTATTEESQSDGTTTGTGQASAVACRFGLVNDPYPGQCRHYVDSDGDGVCDYSLPGSGSHLTGNDEASLEQGFSQRRRNWGQP